MGLWLQLLLFFTFRIVTKEWFLSNIFNESHKSFINLKTYIWVIQKQWNVPFQLIQ